MLGDFEKETDDDEDNNDDEDSERGNDASTNTIVSKKSLGCVYQCLFAALDDRLKRIEWCLKQISSETSANSGMFIACVVR